MTIQMDNGQLQKGNQLAEENTLRKGKGEATAFRERKKLAFEEIFANSMDGWRCTGCGLRGERVNGCRRQYHSWRLTGTI